MAFVPPVRNPIAHGNMVRYNAITASRSRVSQLHMAADKSEILGKVRSIVVQQLAVEESQVTPSASFTQDLGADSLDTVELIMALEEGFDVSYGLYSVVVFSTQRSTLVRFRQSLAFDTRQHVGCASTPHHPLRFAPEIGL